MAPASSRDATGSTLRQVLSLCDPLTVEILFVSLLGLHGLECLRMAVRLLPEKLDNRGDKWTSVKRILDVGGVLPSRSDNAPITTSTLRHFRKVSCSQPTLSKESLLTSSLECCVKRYRYCPHGISHTSCQDSGVASTRSVSTMGRPDLSVSVTIQQLSRFLS